MDARARYVAGCVAIIGWSLAVVAPVFGPVPMLWYYPLEHSFELAARAHGFATSWFGRSTLALAGGLLGLVIGMLVARSARARSPRALTLVTWWATMAVVLALSVYAYQLAHRVPVPEPLPAASLMHVDPRRSAPDRGTSPAPERAIAPSRT